MELVRNKKIWIDLDNSPHVPFFKPIIEELENRGYTILLTARDCSQTYGLADLFNLKCKRVGKHYGKHVIFKIIGLLIRALQLMPIVLREKPSMALSHGSRTQVLLSKILNIPSVLILDYEYTNTFLKPTWFIAPEVIPDSSINSNKKNIYKYQGIKEDVYVPNFRPNPAILKELGLNRDEIIVIMRPPATEAHYHNPQSEELFNATIEILTKIDNTRIILLPRNERQTAIIKKLWHNWCSNGKIIIPSKVVDGLNLIWHSDLVISGGGTMNREAAALGVPVYSIFRGKIGEVDRYLSKTGRLTLIESAEAINKKIKLIHRDRKEGLSQINNKALINIVDNIISITNIK